MGNLFNENIVNLSPAYKIKWLIWEGKKTTTSTTTGEK